jgi:hypothetical protein
MLSQGETYVARMAVSLSGIRRRPVYEEIAMQLAAFSVRQGAFQ